MAESFRQSECICQDGRQFCVAFLYGFLEPGCRFILRCGQVVDNQRIAGLRFLGKVEDGRPGKVPVGKQETAVCFGDLFLCP